ncbi:unnamed protein product [Arabis nemorensis]|uniref:Uncharacterized protein n=1 Tax=Arabis nemorensis TaxID=586526 RepID=A0A565B684_9BRAS|nr:unnamed protein product [Arabis nemorensis]
MSNIPLFDFQEYISRYSGRPQLLRIEHMLKHQLLDEDDKLEALRFLFDRLKWDRWAYRTDTKFLTFVSNEISGRLGASYSADSEMLKKMELDYNDTLDNKTRLLRYTTLYAKEERENARNNAREENPKKQADKELAAHNLGEFEYNSGKIWEAYEALRQIPYTLLLMIVALECRYFEDLCSLAVQPVINTPECPHNQNEMDFKLICIRSLAHLGRGYGLATDHYYSAACLFANLIKFNMRWLNSTFGLLEP